MREHARDLARRAHRGLHRRLRHRVALPVEQRLLPSGRQLAAHQALELHAFLRVARGEPRLPRRAFGRAAPTGLAPRGEDRLGHDEVLVRPAEVLARRLGVVLEQLAAVGDTLVLDARHAETDQGVALDHRRPRIELRRGDRRCNRILVVAVALLHVPAGAGEADHVVLGHRLRRRAVVGHPVRVVEEDQPSEAQVPGERDHLVAETFHQAAVADQRVGPVVDDVVAELLVQHRLRDRHAGGVGDALPQRAGRDLDAVVRLVLRVPRRGRAELAEALHLLDRERRVAGEVQQRVDQRRAVPVRLHEAVAVGPARAGRVEAQVAREQRGADVGGAERRAGVPVADVDDRVQRKEADGVRHLAGSRCHGSCSGVRGVGIRPASGRSPASAKDCSRPAAPPSAARRCAGSGSRTCA